jgi:hypothetical protein
MTLRQSGESRFSLAAHPYLVRALPVIVCCWTGLSGIVQAADSWQTWPEVSVFRRLNEQVRIYVDASAASGKESDIFSGDLAVYLDLSLKRLKDGPILKAMESKPILSALDTVPGLNLDFQRGSAIWARIGYDRVFDVAEGDKKVSEDRGVISFYGKIGLPREFFLESRLRADLRWIGGDYSTRYRFKLEATREFTIANHIVVPYMNVEWFYDTRYDGWARTLFQLGPEVTVNDHFRFEVYLARQVDHLPEHSSMNAGGLVAKWYF